MFRCQMSVHVLPLAWRKHARPHFDDILNKTERIMVKIFHNHFPCYTNDDITYTACSCQLFNEHRFHLNCIIHRKSATSLQLWHCLYLAQLYFCSTLHFVFTCNCKTQLNFLL